MLPVPLVSKYVGQNAISRLYSFGQRPIQEAGDNVDWPKPFWRERHIRK